MLRWAVNVAAWIPTADQWQLVLGCLPQEEQQRCLRYRKEEDKKRSVVSQILQRACVSRLLGEDWQHIPLQRTKGNKPFYAGSRQRPDAPNLNYNVSHEVRAEHAPWSSLQP
jgi:phosphopantetheinyl transferase